MKCDFGMILSVIVKDKTDITMRVVLENYSDDDYTINTDAILMNGLTTCEDLVVSPDVGCDIAEKEYDPEYFVLKGNGLKEVYVNISNNDNVEGFNFINSDPGMYKISFTTSFVPCLSTTLTGEVEFVLL